MPPPRRRRIALDIGSLHYLETYRATACRGVLRYAQTAGTWELLYNDHHFSLTGKYRRLADLPRLGAEGIILFCCDRRQRQQLQRLPLVAVTLSSDAPGAGLPAVLSDDEAVGRLGAEHFLERGFRSLGFCGAPAVPWDAARWRGFAERAAALGAEASLFRSVHSSDPAASRRLGRRLSGWLAAAPKPFAVLGADDTYAFQVLEAAQRLGLRVPQEVAVLGVDNNLLVCSSTQPPLSSIEQDAFQAGYRAAQMMEDLLNGAAPPRAPLLVAPRGVQVRASSDVFAVADPVVEAAVAFIGERLAQPLGVEAIAAAAGVSRRTLEVRFSARLGTTLNRFLRQRRLERAKALLLDPNLSVQEVARLSGYPSPSHFCAQFREATAATPAVWRQQAAAHGPGAPSPATPPEP